MATLKTLHCLLFLMLYNMVIVANSQDESRSVASSVNEPFSSLFLVPSPFYAPAPRNIPYPATPVSPSLPGILASHSPSYPSVPISSPAYAPAPKNIPYPATPISPSLPSIPASHSPSYPSVPVSSPLYAPAPRNIPYPATPVSPSLPCVPVTSPPVSSNAPAPRGIPYPATPVFPGVPVSYSPSDSDMPVSSPPSSSYAPAPAPMSISYPAMPVSPCVPVSHSPSDPVMPVSPTSTPSYAPTPRSIPYPATLVSPSVPVSHSPSDSTMPVSSPSDSSYAPAPENNPHPATPVSPPFPSVPISHSPSYPSVPVSSPFSIPQPTPAPTEPVYDPSIIKAAYWPVYNGLDSSTINTTYLTHIYYAFILIDGLTYKLIVTPSDEKLIPQFINTLRQKSPPVKTFLSIGGYDFNQTNYFSNMSTTEQKRAIFINSTIEIARNYGFDGVDLDWEFPSNNQEMFNLALLFREWRKALEIEARTCGKPRLLLTAAVYYSSRFINYGENRSYPIQAINSYTDWISPMCYDYHGSWENFTGPNAALFDPNGNFSTSYGLGSWIESGLSPKKVVMGLPLYGRTWKLKDPNMDWIGAPAIGMGPGEGVLTYSEILEFNNNNDKGKVYFDGETVSYYSVQGDYWVGYDDNMSVGRKVEYARSLNLGGYFFWALGMDNNGILIRQASDSGC